MLMVIHAGGRRSRFTCVKTYEQNARHSAAARFLALALLFIGITYLFNHAIAAAAGSHAESSLHQQRRENRTGSSLSPHQGAAQPHPHLYGFFSGKGPGRAAAAEDLRRAGARVSRSLTRAQADGCGCIVIDPAAVLGGGRRTAPPSSACAVLRGEPPVRSSLRPCRKNHPPRPRPAIEFSIPTRSSSSEYDVVKLVYSSPTPRSRGWPGCPRWPMVRLRAAARADARTVGRVQRSAAAFDLRPDRAGRDAHRGRT